jgi:ribonuclease P protein component
MTDHRFPKQSRLLSGRQFDGVFAARTSAADRWLVVYGIENDLGRPRLGLAVPRRVGSAVTRNRWKRVLREAFRLCQTELPPLDLVCVPRTGKDPGLTQLKSALIELTAQVEKKRQRSRARSAEEREDRP